MRWNKTLLWAGVLGMTLAGSAGIAQANDWGRFYHYPYSYFPFNFRKPFRSSDFDMQRGYPMYPQYMCFPPYYRTDLYYPYLRHLKAGNNIKSHYQGNHFQLDIF